MREASEWPEIRRFFKKKGKTLGKLRVLFYD